MTKQTVQNEEKLLYRTKGEGRVNRDGKSTGIQTHKTKNVTKNTEDIKTCNDYFTIKFAH